MDFLLQLFAGFPELFERYRVSTRFDSGSTNSTEAYALVASEPTRRVALQAGDSLEIDDVRIEVQLVPQLEMSKNGKFKWVISEVPLGI